MQGTDEVLAIFASKKKRDKISKEMNKDKRFECRVKTRDVFVI